MPAYTDLVRDHHALVYRVALGVLRDSAAAEDVAQDVFLSFFVDPGALDRAQNVRAFVCRAALNRALDVRKAGLRRAVRESAVSGRKEPMSAIDVIFRRELRDKVSELPEIQRQAVDLHYFQGLTLAETAEVLDIPSGTASRRISDAVATLRKWLSAAAFVGLVAVLEGELSALEAAPVPHGLAARLIRLPRVRPAPPRSLGSKMLRGAGALCVAVFLAFLAGITMEARESQDRLHCVTAEFRIEPPADPTSGSETGPDHGVGAIEIAASPVACPAETVEALAEFEQTIEGFLFRTSVGLFLAGEIVPDAGEQIVLRTGLHRPFDGRIWKLAGGGLESWPASDTTNFTPFLQDAGAAASAPHARVRLRARVPAAPQRWQVALQKQVQPQFGYLDIMDNSLSTGPDGAVRIVRFERDSVEVQQPDPRESTLMYRLSDPASDSGSGDVAEAIWLMNEAQELSERSVELATVSRVLLEEVVQRRREEMPAPEIATVLEVLEVELLSDAWLEAWRDLYATASRIHAGAESVPDDSASAVQLGEAIRRVRLARAGQTPAAWRIRMEHKFAAAAVATLAARGYSNLMPGMPTVAELREAFLAASSPEALKAILESRWGIESLSLTMNVLASGASGCKGLELKLGSGSDPNVLDYDIEVAQDGGALADPVLPAVVSMADIVALPRDDFLAQQAATRNLRLGQANTPNW